MSGILIRVFEAVPSIPFGERPTSESFLEDPKEKAIHEVLVKGHDKLHTVG